MKEKNYDGIFTMVSLATGIGIAGIISLILPYSDKVNTIVCVCIAVLISVGIRFLLANKFPGIGKKK